MYLIKYGVFSLKASASELNDLLIVPWLLATKLIAWEGQNLQTCTTKEALIKSRLL